jgi:hypothetical protein
MQVAAILRDISKASLRYVSIPAEGLKDGSVLPPTMTVSKSGFPNGSVSITNPADDLTRPPFSDKK